MSPREPRRPRGLVEAHAHLAALGQSLELPDLAACRSVAECLDRVRREVARRAGPDGPAWVRFLGARPEGWREARWPTLAELDAAAPATPCVLLSFDFHAAVANSAAMAGAGLRPGVPVGDNGIVAADPRGEPTGLLLEDAARAAWNAAPEPTLDQRERHLATALDRLAALGFVEVHDLLSQPWLGPLLARLERRAGLPIGVHLYPPLAEVEAAAAGRAAWESRRVRLAGAKVFADGTINSRTALVLADYADPLPGFPRGRAMLAGAELDHALALTRSMGLGLAVHAIGDGAVRMVLDAVERARSSAGQARRNGRGPDAPIRIEHAELIDPADVPRFARLGVVASVQPCHLLADVEALRRYLPHRLDRVLPLRDLIDAGCRPGDGLRFGSDAPIVRPDPADSIRAAVHRRREGAPESEAIAPAQRITEAEAWAAFRSLPGADA